MSIKIVALLHPFKTDRLITHIEETKPINELFEDLCCSYPIEYARFMINDEPTADLSRIPEDGDTLIIRVLPSGDSPKEAGKNAGWITSVVGALMIVTGVILLPTGVGSFLIAAGVGTIASGAGMLYMSTMIPDITNPSGQNQESLPQIRGGRNQAKPWGAIPIILGKHLISPPYAAGPYTEISGDDQYLHQLFCIGYGQLNITDLKIGDTPIEQFIGVDTEILQDGSVPTLYPHQSFENSVATELKFDSQITKRTPSGATTIEVDLIFPSGLVRYDNDGDANSRSVVIEVYRKLASEPEGSYTLVNEETFESNEAKTLRRTLSFSVAEGQYDIRIVRTTEDSDSNQIIDKCYWSALRIFKAAPSISSEALTKHCHISLRIKASDQLNGVVDQFNCIAESIVPDYIGSGSGSVSWVDSASSNPASLLLWILRGPMNPRPIDDAKIDWPSFEAWHTWCDNKGYEVNAIIDSVKPIREVAKNICAFTRSSLTIRDGKYTIVQDIEKTTPVQLFSPRNSYGFSGHKSFAEKIHALQIQFINRDAGYVFDERFVYDDGYNADGSSELLEATKFRKVSMWGVTDPEHIYKEGRFQIAAARLRPEIFTLNVDIEHLVSTKGDYVKVQHDVPLLGLAAGRIKQVLLSTTINGILIDETVLMEVGKSYGITVRRSDGSLLTASVVNIEAETTSLEFVTPLALDAVEEGDLFTFGEQGYETEDMLIVAVEPKADLSARLTMVHLAPGIHNADSGTIPDFESNITLPGDFRNPTSTEKIYNPDDEIIELEHQRAEEDAQRPTREEVTNGYDDNQSGATINPEQDVIHTIPFPLSVSIVAVKQQNLKWLKERQIQVTDNPGSGDWYRPISNGVDWKGSLGGYATYHGEMYSHANLPPSDPIIPLPYTLYYRTRAIGTHPDSVNGAWSDPVSAEVNPIDGQEIVNGSITEAKYGALSIPPGAVQDGAVWFKKLSVLANNLVNPVSISHNLRGWGNVDENGDGSTSLSYNSSENGIAVTNTGNFCFRSKSFEIDHNKIYRINFKYFKSAADGLVYIGASGSQTEFNGYEGPGNGQGAEIFDRYSSARAAAGSAENAYFISGQTGSMILNEITCYIIGANRSINDVPKHDGPSTYPFLKLRDSTRYVGLRFLNWSNSASTTMYVKDISVSEVGTGQLVAENIDVADLVAASAFINSFVGNTALLESIAASSAFFTELASVSGFIERLLVKHLSAADGQFGAIQTDKVFSGNQVFSSGTSVASIVSWLSSQGVPANQIVYINADYGPDSLRGIIYDYYYLQLLREYGNTIYFGQPESILQTFTITDIFGLLTVQTDIEVKETLKAKNINVDSGSTGKAISEFKTTNAEGEINFDDDGDFFISGPVKLRQSYNDNTAIHAFLGSNGTSDNLFDILNTIDALRYMPNRSNVHYGCNIDCVVLGNTGTLWRFLRNGVTWITPSSDGDVHLKYIEKIDSDTYYLHGYYRDANRDDKYCVVRALRDNTTQLVRAVIGTIG